MSSKAEAYFRDYTVKQAAEMIAALPSAPEIPFENDWMDFKSGDDLNAHLSILKQISKETVQKNRDTQKEGLKKFRSEWSRIVGGFANNEGGIIIWGIHAKGKENELGNDVDRPLAIRLVEDLDGGISLLYKLTRDATDPVLSGIEHIPLAWPKEAKSGFIVSYIPEGKSKPYRSDLAGELFYMRTGESFHKLSVSNLRQLYYPKSAILVSVNIKYISKQWVSDYNIGRARPGKQCHLLEIRINNQGGESIKEPYIKIDIDGGLVFMPGAEYSLPVGSDIKPEQVIPVIENHNGPVKLPVATLHAGMQSARWFLVEFGFMSEFGTLAVRVFSENNPVLGNYIHYRVRDEEKTTLVEFAELESQQARKVD